MLFSCSRVIVMFWQWPWKCSMSIGANISPTWLSTKWFTYFVSFILCVEILLNQHAFFLIAIVFRSLHSSSSVKSRDSAYGAHWSDTTGSLTFWQSGACDRRPQMPDAPQIHSLNPRKGWILAQPYEPCAQTYLKTSQYYALFSIRIILLLHFKEIVIFFLLENWSATSNRTEQCGKNCAKSYNREWKSDDISRIYSTSKCQNKN